MYLLPISIQPHEPPHNTEKLLWDRVSCTSTVKMSKSFILHNTTCKSSEKIPPHTHTHIPYSQPHPLQLCLESISQLVLGKYPYTRSRRQIGTKTRRISAEILVLSLSLFLTICFSFDHFYYQLGELEVWRSTLV